jgi:hypothetical protein
MRISCLRNGCTVDIQDQRAGDIRVGGVGGCYGPSDYLRRSDRLQGYAKRQLRPKLPLCRWQYV